ncbi:AAA domain-containing protein [Aspergillus egyptiacus]|nr:AAA domain-containing protein [Aspergillus egyptiacus]
MQPASLYIVGAQCTGKTTLVRALHGAFSRSYPSLDLRPVTEVARRVLQQHQFTRDDLTNNPQRALELQRLILVAQAAEEGQSPHDPVLCDRSGVDPIVYAVQYGPPRAQEKLESLSHWHCLRDRMRRSLVILCPPHPEWLVDDGTRYMAKTGAEWEELHRTFIQVLEANRIPFHAIPRELVDLEERVDHVLHLWSGYGAWEPSTSS